MNTIYATERSNLHRATPAYVNWRS